MPSWKRCRKTLLLAGPPTEMDNIPLFSRRTVYVSDEAVQPLYDRYYRQISERVRHFYDAYYAAGYLDCDGIFPLDRR